MLCTPQPEIAILSTLAAAENQRKREQPGAHRCPPRTGLPGNQRSRRWVRRAGSREQESHSHRPPQKFAAASVSVAGKGECESTCKNRIITFQTLCLLRWALLATRTNSITFQNTAPLADGEVQPLCQQALPFGTSSVRSLRTSSGFALPITRRAALSEAPVLLEDTTDALQMHCCKRGSLQPLTLRTTLFPRRGPRFCNPFCKVRSIQGWLKNHPDNIAGSRIFCVPGNAYFGESGRCKHNDHLAQGRKDEQHISFCCRCCAWQHVLASCFSREVVV